MAVEVFDYHSGISEFSFTVHDTKDNRQIISETQVAQQVADVSYNHSSLVVTIVKIVL